MMNMMATIMPMKTMVMRMILLMDKILHDPKDPKLWELRYIPFSG